MKSFFLVAILISAGLYGVAEWTLERPPHDGVVRLRWATDPNPARNLQAEIFGRRQLRLKPTDAKDWTAVCQRLTAAGAAATAPKGGKAPIVPAGPKRALARLWNHLSPDDRALVVSASAQENDQAVRKALNDQLLRADLFDASSIEELDLSYDAQLLADRQWGKPQDSSDILPFVESLLAPPRQKLTKVEEMALNRRILEAAFGDLVTPAHRVEVTVESGAAEKIIVQCATGTGPDVLDVYSKGQMGTYVEAGILVDLTAEKAEERGFGPGNTYPAIKDGLLVDGRQYRYPCNVWSNCVIYNPDIFDDHGVPYPREGWTYDQFIEAAKKIVAGAGKSGQRHLAVANYSNGWMFEDLLIGHGGEYFSPDGLVSRLDTPPALAAMKLYSDMMHVHKVLPTPAEAVAMSSQGGWGSGAITWFSNQQAAMIFIGRWYLCQAPQYPGLRKDPSDPHSDLKLRCIRLPAVAGRTSSGECDARGNGINITSPLRQDATKFLHYLASREYGMVIVHDGDALPPNPALAREGKDLVNDFARDPSFHQPFIDAVSSAHPPDMSPFIDGMLVGRWLDEALSKVENRLLTSDQAMRAMASEINQRIRRNIERRTDLQRRFEKITGHKWTPDWQYEQPKAK